MEVKVNAKKALAAFVVSLALLLSTQGCEALNPNSQLGVFITTTQVPSEVKQFIIFVSKIQLLPAGSEAKAANDSAWITVAGKNTFDLKELQNTGLYVSQDEIKKGEYIKVRILIEKVVAEIGDIHFDYTGPASLEVDMNLVVQHKRGAMSHLTLRFDAAKSIATPLSNIVFMVSTADLIVP